MASTATTETRRVTAVVRGRPASDGAGVRLTRVIGQPVLPDLDPFLLLDEFRSAEGSDYVGGFPDHPHRGFETVTYMLAGRMRHGDNQGNVGLLAPGSVQWMPPAAASCTPRCRSSRTACCGASSSGSTCRRRTR